MNVVNVHVNQLITYLLNANTLACFLGACLMPLEMMRLGLGKRLLRAFNITCIGPVLASSNKACFRGLLGMTLSARSMLSLTCGKYTSHLFINTCSVNAMNSMFLSSATESVDEKLLSSPSIGFGSNFTLPWSLG